jgi:hypothetical protein
MLLGLPNQPAAWHFTVPAETHIAFPFSAQCDERQMMFRSLLVLASSTTSALAHPSTAIHDHPHNLSSLPGIELIAAGVLVAALAVAMLLKFKRL